MSSQADMHISEVLTSISANYCPSQFAYNISCEEYDVASVWSGQRKGVSARQLADPWQISPKLLEELFKQLLSYAFDQQTYLVYPEGLNLMIVYCDIQESM